MTYPPWRRHPPAAASLERCTPLAVAVISWRLSFWGVPREWCRPPRPGGAPPRRHPPPLAAATPPWRSALPVVSPHVAAAPCRSGVAPCSAPSLWRRPPYLSGVSLCVPLRCGAPPSPWCQRPLPSGAWSQGCPPPLPWPISPGGASLAPFRHPRSRHRPLAAAPGYGVPPRGAGHRAFATPRAAAPCPSVGGHPLLAANSPWQPPFSAAS